MNIRNLLLIAVTAILCLGCREDDFPGLADGNPEDVIRMGAYVAAEANTRAAGGDRKYMSSGDIDQGTYYLVYSKPTTSSYAYGQGYVDFGDTEGPTTGFCYIMDGSTRKDLKWMAVANHGTSNATFYLHNVPNEYYTFTTNSNRIYQYYNKTVNPFQAGPLDKEFGSNDLLSGSGSGNNKTGKINIELYHRLALLRIWVKVYGAKADDWVVNLENAEVSITNLATKVGQFRITSPSTFGYRASGTSNSSSVYGTYNTINTTGIPLVKPTDSKLHWEEGYPQEGSMTNDEGEEYTVCTYVTQDFVFPPQTIPPTSGYGRPKLTIRVPKSDVTGVAGQEGYVEYSGYLPDVMFTSDSEGNLTSPTPKTLALSSGYILNVTASINSPETDLVFAPAKVEAWISKTTATINTRQGGIYNVKDFNALVDAYQNGRYWELERYGYQDENGDYIFQLWGSLELDKDAITGCMKSIDPDAPKFAFLFNSYSVTLEEPSQDGTDNKEVLSGSSGELEFYSIVTGNRKTFKGIKTTRDMENFLSCTEQFRMPAEMLEYAQVSNSDNTISFEIDGSFDIDFGRIIWKIPTQLWGYDVKYSIKPGVTLGIKMPDTTEKVTFTATEDGYDPLKKLMLQSTTSSINNEDDFYLLTKCYNYGAKYFNNSLRPFGTQNATTLAWTLSIRNNLTLDGPRTFLSMRPDPENGKPTYSITLSNSSYYVDILDDKVPSRSNSTSIIYAMFSGTGRAQTYYSMTGSSSSSSVSSSSIIGYYNNTTYLKTNYANLWQYGRFENGKWIISLTYPSSQQYTPYYSALFGKMIPDEEAGKYDYEFELGPYTYEVRRFPQIQGGSTGTAKTYYKYFTQDGSSAYDYPSSAADLKRVADGTYWIYFEEWKQNKGIKGKKK